MRALELAPTLDLDPSKQGFERLHPVAIADLLLGVLALRGARSVLIEPSCGKHEIRYERGATTSLVATINSALGDAVVARLSLLSGLPLEGGRSQLGRLKIRATGRLSEATSLLVATQRGEQGLSAEVRRITSAQDEARVEQPQEQEQAGSYRLLGALASGGMGTVYRAEHVVLQKQVALKVLHAELSDDPQLNAQFVVEARAACRVRHPGIVDVTDFGYLDDGRAFFVMELIEAPTLATTLTQGPMAPERALSIARRIAGVMSAAGESGVVHRDLKPSNIFLLPDDRVKVGDFGLATIRDARNQVPDLLGERILGTALYMAPEQCSGEATDHRTDLYSLGCILFEMLTGSPPFNPANPIRLLQMHKTEPPPAPVGPEGPLPDAVASLLRKALEKRPEARFQSAHELEEALRQAEQIVGRGGWRRWLPR